MFFLEEKPYGKETKYFMLVDVVFIANNITFLTHGVMQNVRIEC